MLRTVGFGLFVVVALLLLPANAPVQVGYVYSDSMEPTLGVDDGYLLVPADAVEVGDVVTFQLETRDTLVTHRVVGRTDGGFLTKGDANPSADQASGHPPVTSEDVVGRVLTVGGTPLVRQTSVPAGGVARREGAPTDALTDRQREVLQCAHNGGFFDRPRAHTGEEIAAKLEIAPATFHQHVRTGTSRLFDALFD
ncbi:signal peptidase I [Halospeciosus flavus]|uniref:Signal peptidase I n=1 Tax=Halospeciosus flavus TaxID=3032283 RepID=A0ABD5Z1H0_9EURY|nr:signal peptidase I [Halospeciosus flavus]